MALDALPFFCNRLVVVGGGGTKIMREKDSSSGKRRDHCRIVDNYLNLLGLT